MKTQLLSQQFQVMHCLNGLPLDETTMDYTVNIPDLPNAPDNNNGRWKYNEDLILKDIHEYVSGTYRSHYTGKERWN